MELNQHLLEISDLCTSFKTEDGMVRAVDGVSLHIDKGETLAVVGESGSGKSVTSLSIMRLLAKGGEVTNGKIFFNGEDLVTKSERQMQRIRGNRIAMIFQDPMTSLNPVYTVGSQIAEVIILHQNKSKREALKMAVDLLELVGIPDPASRAKNYPHELSGGMRQRVMIAMALSCRPELLIADEPTTALDVTVQAQMLDLIKDLQNKIGMGVLFITHDLGVVAEVADRVSVMYAGRVVEAANAQELFDTPKMPYTQGLLDSIPELGRSLTKGNERLEAIPGSVPNPASLPPGCAFHPRCKYAELSCTETDPKLDLVATNHWVRCLKWNEIPQRNLLETTG